MWMKKHLIVWSGGLDSTAIIMKALAEAVKFHTVYFELGNNIAKTKKELLVRAEIKKLIEERYDIDWWTDYTIRIPEFTYHNYISNGQPIAWLFGLTMFTNTYYENIMLGYVKGDDFWHVRHDFIKAYENLQKVDGKEKVPPLAFPLEWCTKKDVVDLYNTKFRRRIAHMTWTCDGSIGGKLHACGQCTACKRRRAEVKPLLEIPLPTKAELDAKKISEDVKELSK